MYNIDNVSENIHDYYFVKDLKFNKERDFFKKRLEKIPRYRTKEEKFALLLEDDTEPEIFFDTLFPEIDFKPINKIETMAFILKGREISVSDEISLVLPCEKCKAVNDVKIDLEEVIDVTNYNPICDEPPLENLPIGIFESVFEMLDDDELDKLTIKQTNMLNDLVLHNTSKIFNVMQHFTCRIQSCQEKNDVPINPIGFISKVSLSGVYTEIFNLAYYTSTTYSDIETLYPIERNIYINMAKKEVERQPLKSMM
jgi:hypothetical protein